MQARWRTRTWEISPDSIRALERLTLQKKVKKQTAKSRDGVDPTLNQGYEAQQIPVDYLAHRSAGVDPLKEYQAWQRLAQDGVAGPFYLGGRRVGPPRVYLQEISLDVDVLSNDGEILQASISLLFVQEGATATEATGGQAAGISSKGSAVGATGGVLSALGVGPSAAMKRSVTL